MADSVDVARPARFVRSSYRVREHPPRQEGRYMVSQQMETSPDLAIVDRLSTAFNRCFETLDAGGDVFAPDAFFDLFPPLWRLQLQGPDAFAAQLRAIAEGRTTARILRVVPTATGFVMEHEETQRGAKKE